MNNNNNNSIPVLGIPFYNRADLLGRCVESIDHPVDLLVIIQQGPELVYLGGGRRLTRITRLENGEEYPKLLGIIPDTVKSIVSIIHPNAGVAGAWNEIIKLHPAPYWMISNNDIQFTPGDLQKMHAFVMSAPGILGMAYGFGASWFAITGDGVKLAGLFDENIYPAYLEDCDMSRRMDLLGVTRSNVPDCHAVHGVPEQRGSCTVNASPELAKRNALTHSGNFHYYRQKWGGSNGEERFSTPFNDPHWPIDFWRFDPARRAMQQLLWEKP